MLTGLQTTYRSGSYGGDVTSLIKIYEDVALASGQNPDALSPLKSNTDNHLIIGYGYDLLETNTDVFIADLLGIGVALSSKEK